jgi:AraC family transcriptional activator of pobA
MQAHRLDRRPSRAADVPSIRFDRTKYGRQLLADACEIRSLPRFITTPLAHRLQFYEIALVADGQGCLELDGSTVAIGRRRLLLTRPGEIRRWRLDTPRRLDGSLAFFEGDFINEFFADPRFVERLPIVAAPAVQRSVALAPADYACIVDMIGAMRDELRCVRADTSHALRAQTYRLLIAVQRLMTAPADPPADHSRAVARRFGDLVEDGFATTGRVAHYAARLHVTPRHLNFCVQAATGRSASDVIAQRLLLECRRLLLHSELSMREIADSLNFADPSYFTRFFRRHAGVTPKQFRVSHGSPIFSPVRDLPPAAG